MNTKIYTTHPLRSQILGIIIPQDRPGKILGWHLDGRLYIDFGLLTVHLLRPDDPKIKIISLKESNRAEKF